MTYELRDICSKDLFTMMQIVRKIGVGEFKKAFTGIEIFTDSEGNLDLEKMGIPIAMELGSILIENLPNAETDIYNFLKNLSGVPVEQLQKMPPAEFLEMILAVVRKPEFKDFFTVLSRQLS